jgi:hypothetical protein
MLEHLETRLTAVGISPEAVNAIKEIKNDVLPFKSFRKQFQRRKGIAGYSMDAQRAYAAYMSSFANHIARVKFDSKFKDDLENIKSSIQTIVRKGGDATKRSQILEWLNDHLEYVMNPVSEFTGLRSLGFFWFLGFHIKSAFVNATQIALVGYPYLAARYGEPRAVAALVRANRTAINALTGKGNVDPNVMSMLTQGISESWLDESLATELALARSERNLEKSLPRHWLQTAWLKTSHYGSMPFHIVEKFNRHIQAIATYRLAIADGKSHSQAVVLARKSVQKTMYEYARYARPRFMRGKFGGTVFVFQNFMQNSLFFALGGDPGAFRMIIMLFMLGGLMGLPFGENIADLIDAALTALKRKTGAKDPYTSIRVDLRQLMKELELDPDLMLHGMSSSTFGLANAGEAMGWPIPDIDLSGSLSMGRILPGTELLKPGQADTFEKLTSRTTERAGGAIVSGFAGVGRALLDDHPDQWKRWEKAMPAFMKGASKSARYAVRGEEATRGGHQIAEFDRTDWRDRLTMITQGMGFTPRDVSKGWEKFLAPQQAIIYYQTWQSSVLEQWNYARDTKDRELEKVANSEIRDYNAAVPFPEMKIGPDLRRQSFETYKTRRKFAEAGVEQNKRFRRLSSSIEAVFEDADKEDTQ